MENPPPKRTIQPWVVGLIVFVLAFDIAFVFQRLGGAYQSEYGGHPDEAAHYVTGLFVHDAAVEALHYARDGFRGSAVETGQAFANDFYQHYPKVGLGVWPPAFYVVQAAWTLPLGVSRAALLWLMALLAAALAWLVFAALRSEYGNALAGIGAALLLALPLVRGAYSMVMAETLSAIFMFGAMLAFGRFLDGERKADALWFGLLAALAILTKGTGLALVLAAPLAILFTRRFHVLKRPVLWGAILIVAVLAGPWTWATRELGKGGWLEPNLSWNFTREALPYYAGKFGFGLGVVALVLFVAGVIVKARQPSLNAGKWSAAGALIVAVIAFQSLIPVGLEARHLVPVLPAAILFVIAALGWAQARVPRAIWTSALVFVAVTLTWTVLPLKSKPSAGFAPLAKIVVTESAPVDTVLVSSDATGEGMFIAEVAEHELRPGHIIQRASKSLASSTWSGGDYQPAFADDEDVLKFLQREKIAWLVVDGTVSPDKRRTHHEQLSRLVEDRRDVFQPVAESEIVRGGEHQAAPARLYKVARQR